VPRGGPEGGQHGHAARRPPQQWGQLPLLFYLPLLGQLEFSLLTIFNGNLWESGNEMVDLQAATFLT
jgi:hypothetical protein